MENKMFCYQCQETAKCMGCTEFGVCGKSPDLARMQDLLIYVTKGLSEVTTRLIEEGDKINKDIDNMITINLFTTITNANFDNKIFYERVLRTLKFKEELLDKLQNKNNLSDAALWSGITEEDIDEKSKESIIGVLATADEDIRSLKELITYGLKGIAAYMKHANSLGYDSKEISIFTQKTLAKTLSNEISIDELMALTLETGKVGVEAMALLDKANTETYGNPEITKVNIGVRNNPGILISGHDLSDLEQLLKQTEGTGVDVYTHSEMLPANYYPAFKKYSHFVGNYGNAWWKQKEEFESFNGPILITTNCIVPPSLSYKYRLYTTGAVGFEGCVHISGFNGKEKDFSQIIEHAKKCSAPKEIESGEIIGGFAHNQVMQLSDKIVNAIKSGAIKKFFVMAGCDGRVKSRDYYTDFAKMLPKNTVILTAGCAKYRYNKLDLGFINDIPRVLDAGQCNDSYSLALIALKLKEVFELEDINKLPIAFNIAWYEQKAVIVLLSLLYLGVKNIHLGPTLPAFLSPNIGKILVENFKIGCINNVDEDIKMFMEM